MDEEKIAISLQHMSFFSSSFLPLSLFSSYNFHAFCSVCSFSIFSFVSSLPYVPFSRRNVYDCVVLRSWSEYFHYFLLFFFFTFLLNSFHLFSFFSFYFYILSLLHPTYVFFFPFPAHLLPVFFLPTSVPSQPLYSGVHPRSPIKPTLRQTYLLVCFFSYIRCSFRVKKKTHT